MEEFPIVREPGIVPFRWTANGFIAACNAGLVKHSHLEMIEGIVILDVWAPHGVVPDGSGCDPYRWDADEFLAILDAGLIDEPHRVELLDGIMTLKEPPPTLPEPPTGTLLTAPRVVLGHRSVCEPSYALRRPEAGIETGPIRERDLLWALDAVNGFDPDLSPRRDAYARAGVPHYWVADGARRGVWTFALSEGGIYREEGFVSEGESIRLPGLDVTLDAGRLFPPSMG